MTATAHAMIGVAIAAKIGNPALAVPIALASHFALDAIPHWDSSYHRRLKSKREFVIKSALDVLISFVFSFFLLKMFFPATDLIYAYFIIIISQLPDWLTIPYLFLNMTYPPFDWAYKLQKKFDKHLGLPWGLINQIVIIVGIFIFAIFI
jgi:hypothetical protein